MAQVLTTDLLTNNLLRANNLLLAPSGLQSANLLLPGGVVPPSIPAVVQSIIQNNNAAAPTATLPLPATIGNAIIVYVQAFGSAEGITSVTDNVGSVYTLVSGPDNSPTDGVGTGANRWVYATFGLAGAAQVITVHGTVTLQGQTSLVEVSGAHSVDVKQYTTVGNVTAYNGGTLTTSVANELLLAFMGYINGNGVRVFTAGAGWAQVAQAFENSIIGERSLVESQLAVTAGGYAVTATLDLQPGQGGGIEAIALK